MLCNVMENQLKFYIGEKGCIRLIQCFLNPELMLNSPESPKLKSKDKKIDPIHQLFVPSERQKMGEGISCRLLTTMTPSFTISVSTTLTRSIRH